MVLSKTGLRSHLGICHVAHKGNTEQMEVRLYSATIALFFDPLQERVDAHDIHPTKGRN